MAERRVPLATRCPRLRPLHVAGRGAPRAALAAATLGAIVGLSPAAAACPYCSLSQGADTLVYVMGFLLIPYLVVSGTWLWMKRLMATEHEGPRPR